MGHKYPLIAEKNTAGGRKGYSHSAAGGDLLQSRGCYKLLYVKKIVTILSKEDDWHGCCYTVNEETI
jgi:hypothetical protein